MKKKILCALLASSMMLGMTACGERDESSKTAGTGENASSATAEAIESNEDNAAENKDSEGEIKTDNAAEAEDKPLLITGCSFNGDCLLFAENDIDYVYNIKENIMYDTTAVERAQNKYAQYSKGTLVYTFDKSDDAYFQNPEYYNIVTGEFIGKALSTVWGGDYFPVYSCEETADGKVYSFGVVNSECEWVVPMSSEYMICQYDLSECEMAGGSSNLLMFFDDDDQSTSPLYYNIFSDEFVDLPDSGYVVSGSKVLYTSNLTIYMYDMDTKETSIPYPHLYGASISERQYGYKLSAKNNADSVFLDPDFNLLDINLSAFDDPYIEDFNGNYVAVSTKDGEYKMLHVIDYAGNNVIEPIEMERKTYVSLWEDYVLVKNDVSPFVYNLKTNEMVPIDPVQDIFTYWEFGKMVIKKDNAYYIASIDDPNTLLNPFDICTHIKTGE